MPFVSPSDPPNPAHQGRTRKSNLLPKLLPLLTKSCQLGLPAFFVLWLLGKFFRDANLLTGWLFFIPSPVMTVVMLLAALSFAIRRSTKWAILFAILALPPASFVFFVENHFSKPQTHIPSRDTYRIAHWNVLWGMMPTEGIMGKLRSLDADIHVISEPPDELARMDGLHTFHRGPLMVLSKFPLTHENTFKDAPGPAHLITCQTPSGNVRLLIADLPSNLLKPRNPALAKLTQILTETQAHLLLGDLNSPRRSRALDNLPFGYQHAYDSSGSGFSYTWPWIPVYAIDQCIHSRAIFPISYTLQASHLSDHRIQVFEFGINK